MARLFISHVRLDEWTAQERAAVADDQLRLQDGRSFSLHPAVLFTGVVGNEPDPHDLLGRVKTEAQLADLEADHYQQAVIVGDVGYQVVEGFIGEPE